MFIDLSAELADGMLLYPSPYLPRVEVSPLAVHERERRSVQKLVFATHVSTHLDAPYHAVPGGMTVDAIPVDVLCGDCALLHLDVPLEKAPFGREALEPYSKLLDEHERVVLHTGWMSPRWGTMDYFTQGPYMSQEAVAYLLDKGVRLVGTDFPNIDSPEETTPGIPAPRHGEMLGQGVVLVENLLGLERIPGQVFRIFALPLKVVGGDGCPCRVVAEV